MSRMGRITAGLHKSWTVLRTEQKLVCPFDAPVTWYGRAGAGVLVASAAAAGVAVTGLGLYGIGYGVDKAFTTAAKAYDSSEIAAKKQTLESKRRREFEDAGSGSWYRMPHGVFASVTGVVAYGVFCGSKSGFRYSRTAPNFCVSGAGWAVSAFMAGGAAVAGANSITNAHAFGCKRLFADEPRKARQMHEDFPLSQLAKKITEITDNL